ncbi:MAG: hypothetical protein LUD15_06575 [Bacteroides sp.]|nr:hypothetical protein [Bacteroides sp.]
MKRKFHYIGSHIIFNLLLLSGCTGLTTYLFIKDQLSLAFPLVIITFFCFHRVYKLTVRNNQKVALMLDAIENHDHTIRFNENPVQHSEKEINLAINRITQNLKKAYETTLQQDKYYELMLNCLHSGVVVTDDNRYVFQKKQRSITAVRSLRLYPHKTVKK